MQKGHRKQPQIVPNGQVTTKQCEQQDKNNAALDYNTKHKINMSLHHRNK